MTYDLPLHSSVFTNSFPPLRQCYRLLVSPRRIFEKEEEEKKKDNNKNKNKEEDKEEKKQKEKLKKTIPN